MGVALLRKVGRTAGLTEEAEALLAAMGDALDRIETAVEPLRRKRSQIRLTTVATFASHWLLPRLPAFQARHPDVRLSISTTRRPIDLEQEDIDGAIRHGLGHWEGLTSTLLFRETLAPVAAPTVTGDLDTAVLVRARSRYRDWSRWWTQSGRSGRPANDGLDVETRAQALEVALAGGGVAMMDMAYVEDHVAEGRLRLLGDPIQLAEGYHFVHRPQPRNPRLITALRTWLVEQAR